MSLFDIIQKDMYAAMKSGEKEKATTLRTTISKLKDKKIEKREELTQQEQIKVIQSLVKQRKESIELYLKGGRDDLAAVEKTEMLILETYLPDMLNESDIKDIVVSVIQETGASSIADMGKVMPEIMKRGKGLIDGKTAQIFVKEFLS